MRLVKTNHTFCTKPVTPILVSIQVFFQQLLFILKLR